jgi:hypothetical protein
MLTGLCLPFSSQPVCDPLIPAASMMLTESCLPFCLQFVCDPRIPSASTMLTESCLLFSSQTVRELLISSASAMLTEPRLSICSQRVRDLPITSESAMLTYHIFSSPAEGFMTHQSFVNQSNKCISGYPLLTESQWSPRGICVCPLHSPLIHDAP